MDDFRSFVSACINYFAPAFIIASPITSYADQILSIHRKRSSAGFSLDIPLIMLVASIMKIYYWLTVRFSSTLLAQAALMIVVQVILLHVALENRSSVVSNIHQPFEGENPIGSSSSISSFRFFKRPYNFWRWKSSVTYWRFLASYIAALTVAQILNTVFFANPDPANPYRETAFSSFQALIALTIEAVLPVPQLLKNAQARSCAGFRPSVCVNWLLGDAMKIWWFFLQPGGSVPIAFKLCAMFQLCCDSGLAIQFLIWGTGNPTGYEPANPGGVAAGLHPLSIPSTPSLQSLLSGISSTTVFRSPAVAGAPKGCVSSSKSEEIERETIPLAEVVSSA